VCAGKLAACLLSIPRRGVVTEVFLMLISFRLMQIGALAKEGALVEIEVVADA
jgi:hypothetical protein